MHSVTFRASSLKQAQELARFAARSAARSAQLGTRIGQSRHNQSDIVFQVRFPHSEHFTQHA
jgi:hypothetical protein